MPTFGDDEALPLTIPRVSAAIESLTPNIEWIILFTPSAQRPAPSQAISSLAGSQVIIVQDRGKARALQVGATHATGEILLMLDADACPERNALAAVLAPIRNDAADVCAGRVVIGPPIRRGRIALLLHAWARASALVWHFTRRADPSSRWALPGPLYAIRRSFFPATVQLPLIDDASIGLHALRAGARFAYAPTGRTAILPPATYADWLRQKLRVRRGWSQLRQRAPEHYVALRQTMGDQQRRLAAHLGCWFDLLVLHDRALRRIAAFLDHTMRPLDRHAWRTVGTTKRWSTSVLDRDNTCAQ